MKGTRLTTFGQRLRAERERLGMNQSSFGESCGVGKNAQINYEGDKRSPDGDYLMAAAHVGVDVLYVLTDHRQNSVPMPEASALPRRLRERLVSAIEAVEVGLEATGRDVSPIVKAELVMSAYDILAREGESATAQIIRLVKAA